MGGKRRIKDNEMRKHKNIISSSDYFCGILAKVLSTRVALVIGFIMMFLSSGDVFGSNDYALSKPTTWDGWFNEGNTTKL